MSFPFLHHSISLLSFARELLERALSLLSDFNSSPYSLLNLPLLSLLLYRSCSYTGHECCTQRCLRVQSLLFLVLSRPTLLVISSRLKAYITTVCSRWIIYIQYVVGVYIFVERYKKKKKRKEWGREEKRKKGGREVLLTWKGVLHRNKKSKYMSMDCEMHIARVQI